MVTIERTSAAFDPARPGTINDPTRPGARVATNEPAPRAGAGLTTDANAPPAARPTPQGPADAPLHPTVEVTKVVTEKVDAPQGALKA